MHNSARSEAAIYLQLVKRPLPLAAVEDLEFVALVGGEEGGYVAEALG